MTSTQTLQKRFAAAFMPNYGVPPVAIIRGQGCRVTDADGREYLDLIAGIAVSSLGHAHPALVEAVSRQVAEVAHTSNLFLHEREVELAERLLALLSSPGGTAPNHNESATSKNSTTTKAAQNPVDHDVKVMIDGGRGWVRRRRRGRAPSWA